MNNLLKSLLIGLSLLLIIRVEANPEGFIRGQLKLYDGWKKMVYLSYIPALEKKYAVSNDLIIAQSELDSLGNFEIGLSSIPDQWCLLRLHVIKREAPAASLIIGSPDENYFFLIARPDAQIFLSNTEERPVFGNVSLSGVSGMATLEYIHRLSEYAHSLSYTDSLIEKEFIEEVITEKLKSIADSCSNPLVSLYALYQIDFYADFQNDPEYYQHYLSKYKDAMSPYFKAFQRQFPKSANYTWWYLLLLLLFGVVALVIRFWFYKRKNNKLKKLSVQERKVFELLRQGATNQEISEACHIELSTVKSHVSSIFSKLQIKSRKEVMDIKNIVLNNNS